MHGMHGVLAAAGRRGLSAGTVAIVAGGLALFQMTSLMLGPAPGLELQISMAIPGGEPDEIVGPERPDSGAVIGTLMTTTPASGATPAPQVRHRPPLAAFSVTPAAPTAVVAPPAREPAALPPTTRSKHGKAHDDSGSDPEGD